jgi:heavy metal translocating P-type ATPase
VKHTESASTVAEAPAGGPGGPAAAPGATRSAPIARLGQVWNRVTALLALAAIGIYLVSRYRLDQPPGVASLPLWVAIVAGGAPLLYALSRQAWRREFGADFLAGMSIATAAIMGELLVATIIVLMLSGGQALEDLATRRASAVLRALARRMPSIAHRIEDGDAAARDIAVNDIRVGDRLIVYPHEICPVDGTVLAGSGTMDESFLTGEPFRIRKVAGSQVISGALNEDAALTLVADKLAVDSRYARIMQVMRAAEEQPPAIRRLADRLGAFYTPLALAIALASWLITGDATRFLAVLVIATPCPLLLAIPVAIIGAISLAAKRGIVIKRPVVLEQVGQVHTMFFDKTGTLTYGDPAVTELVPLGGADADAALALSASLEQFSKHPLASAILGFARASGLALQPVENISERPGEGLRGSVGGHSVLVTGRKKLPAAQAAALPPSLSGLECIVVVDGAPAALLRFHDRPRAESQPFIGHLAPKHHVRELTLLSGDRDAEVQYLASLVGIRDVRAGLSPEEKLAIVRERTAHTATLYLGDGINDAPAMLAATVGVAFGQSSDITAEAAGAVILEADLGKVDELLHIGIRMRRIALESAVGGMALSAIGMGFAALGVLPPLWGAIGQEGIDLLAVLNAIRAATPGKVLRDF